MPYVSVNNGHPAGGSGDQQTNVPAVTGQEPKQQQPKPRANKPPPARRPTEPKAKETLVNGTTA